MQRRQVVRHVCPARRNACVTTGDRWQDTEALTTKTVRWSGGLDLRGVNVHRTGSATDWGMRAAP